MEREIAIDEDARLERLVSDAEHGETIVLTRDGVPVAEIVPKAVKPAFDRAEARAALENILRIGDGVSLGGLRFKDLINEGRKY